MEHGIPESCDMSFKQVLEVIELLDSANVNGSVVAEALTARGWKGWEVETITGDGGSTDFITISIPGIYGKRGGGAAPTIGVVGRLGSLGARPEIVGMISDADGAIVALSSALKILDMRSQGDMLNGDVIVTTHISPRSSAPDSVRWGAPVRMASAPVDGDELLKREVLPEMDAVLSIDATKANRIINHRGFAISPTVKEGYILRPSDDLLDIMQAVTGKMPAVFPLSIQDITPNQQLRHINSIMTPSAMTRSPVVGVAITAEAAVAGVATGANQPMDLEMAVRFCVETAKAFGRGECRLHDEDEFEKLSTLYGSMHRFQTDGNGGE